MNTIIQSPDCGNNLLRRIINKGNRTWLSTLFCNLRKQRGVSTIGDYPLPKHCIGFAKNHGITFKRKEITTALNKSEELSVLGKKDKMDLLDQLEHVS